MKKSIIYGISLLLFGLSCKDVQKTSPPERATDSLALETVNTDIDPCINAGYQIFKLTADLWVDNWETLHTNTSGVTTVSPELFFSKLDMDSLRSLYPTSDGVRLYYVLQHAQDTIPNLAMKPMKDCQDLNNIKATNVVLYSTIQKKSSFISDSQFQVYKNNWQNDTKMDQVHRPIDVFAYNYGWDELLNRIDPNNGTDGSGVWVRYGFRTLGPEDVKEYLDPGSATPMITGNVVYCNIVYGQSPKRSNEAEFDFVKPCPRFCND
ncbi:MAG: hypothetical protein AAF489_13500 [Bacteroidota bacterium]